MTNSTFSGNSADISGGGIINGDTLTADSHNLADDGTCGGATQATSAEINLQPLASNGGPAQTMALGAGSVAIDAGDQTICAMPLVSAFDQHGIRRPIDGNGDKVAICDSGAFEAKRPPPQP